MFISSTRHRKDFSVEVLMAIQSILFSLEVLLDGETVLRVRRHN